MKVNQLKMIIREVVREEIQLGLKEIIGEITQPVSLSESILTAKESTQLKTENKKPIFKKKNFSSNSVLNDVLNETANGDWKTLGGGEFTSDRMNELVGGQYGDMMKNTPQQVPSSDPMAQFVNKDYREVLKRTNEKQKQKYGK